jgi:DNA invertase Pin-like site-specific DNA recombinase
VSSLDQNTDRQLEGVAELYRVFEDKASGKDVVRPQLEEMLKYVRQGDTVVVHSLDRLARNLDEIRKLVESANERVSRWPSNAAPTGDAKNHWLQSKPKK